MATQTTLAQFARSSSLTTVSIIGSAGRRGDADKMTKELYWRMVEEAERVITEEFRLDLARVHLVSGGAAWADHVAVTLYLQHKAAALTLHVPAAWETTDKGEKFVDNGKSSQSNPGRVANKLHEVFSEKIEEQTLNQIRCCRHLGAKLQVHDGFKKRNDSVAQSRFLIAFSWSEGEAPKKGGTLDTWNKCTGNTLHIPLSLLKESASKPRYYQEHEHEQDCSFSSEELHDLPPTTQAKLNQLQPAGGLPGSVSDEPLPSCSHETTKPASCKHTLGALDADSAILCTASSIGSSLDSGIGSLEPTGSAESADLEEARLSLIYHKGERKRKRSTPANIVDDSDIKCDGVETPKIKCTNRSKRQKVSEFAKKALHN